MNTVAEMTPYWTPWAKAFVAVQFGILIYICWISRKVFSKSHDRKL